MTTNHHSGNEQQMRRQNWQRHLCTTLPSVLFAATLACVAALASCGDGDRAEDSANDGNYAPGEQTTPQSSDTTTSTAPADTVVVPPPSAAEIRSQLAEKFERMGGMDRVNIEADASGVVTLSGTVKTADRKQTAEDAAAMVPGVVRVVNNIQVVG